MRKQKQSSIPGEQSAKTRVSAHASKGIAPPRSAADAPATNNYNYYYHYYNYNFLCKKLPKHLMPQIKTQKPELWTGHDKRKPKAEAPETLHTHRFRV